MATAADLTAALAEVTALTDDLAKWFNIIGADLQKLSDARAARSAAMCIGGSKAAKRLGSGIVSMGDVIADLIAVATASAAHAGIYSETFSGAANQVLTETITGTWITTSTVVIPDSAELGTSPYYGMFDLWQDNTIAGSFDIKARNTGAAPAGTYFFKWIAQNG